MIRGSVMDNLFAGTLTNNQIKYYPKNGINFLFIETDGPVWTVGDRTTITFRLYGNKLEEMKGMTTEEFLDSFVIYFRSTMDYLADQLEEDHKTLKAIPARLRFLPRRIENYGFPEKVPEFMQVDVTLDGQELTLNLSARARILFGSVKNDGSPTADWERKAPVEKTLRKTNMSLNSLQIELRSDPEFPFHKKPCQWILLDYTDGELTRARYRYAIPDKAGLYADAGYSSKYHYCEYDKNMNPTSVGYYTTFEGRALDLRIFFDTEGNVEYYKVEYSSFMDDIKSSWQGTPDQPLTLLNGTEIQDMSEADPRIWDPVWFEK